MATKHKHRSKGDWEKVAKGRADRKGTPATCHPNKNSGGLTMSKGPGSAAYQRLMAKLTGGKRDERS